MLGGILAAIVAIWRVWKGSGPYYHWGMDVGAGLLFWMAVCSANGLDVYLSQRSLATFVGAVAFLWSVQCALGNSRDWRLSGHAFIGLCTLTCLAAWPKAVAGAIKTGEIPALTGTFNNPDTFSILPLFALMLAPGMLERATSRTGWLVCLQMGILFLTLIATGCRASLLGLGIGAVAFAGTLLYHRSSSHFKHIKILLAAPIALALLILPLSNFGLKVFDKYARSVSPEAIAREETRLEVATYGWRAVLQRPVLGAGPGCFGLAFQSVRPPGHDHLYINIAHNDPVEVAVELGLPGFILWATLVLASLHKPFRLLKHGRRPLAAASMMSAVVAIMIYSLFNFVISERPVLWAQFWILGLALTFPSSRLTYKEHPLIRYLTSLCLLALAGWALIFGYRSVQADAYAFQSRDFAGKLQMELALQSLESAIALQPHRVNLRLELVKLEKSWSAFYPGHQSLARRLDALKAARENSPVNLGVLVALADLHVEAEELPQAATYLDEALKLTPHRQSLREKRAALAIRQGDLESAAIHLFLKSSNKKRDAQLASLLVALEIQKPGKAKAVFEQVIPATDRDQTVAVFNLATQNCWVSEQWKPGLSLAAIVVDADPTDLCLRLRWANFTGKLEGDKAEWTLLEKTLSQTQPSSDACYGDLLERWYRLSSDQSQRDKAIARLQDDLETDRRIVRARVLLSQALLEDKSPDKAIALLRDGLDANSRSTILLKQLASLYETAGYRDLAINYYREASEIDPKDNELKAKLRELRKARK